MAKKILSILCALAMMVTMVSVAAFSVSADEPAAFAGISADNWTVTSEVNGTNASSTTVYGRPVTYVDSTYFDATQLLIYGRDATVTSNNSYSIADSFNFSFDYLYYNSTKITTTFNLGDLSIVIGTGSNQGPLRTFTVYYDDTELGSATTGWTNYTAKKFNRDAENTDGFPNDYLLELDTAMTNISKDAIYTRASTTYTFIEMVVNCSYDGDNVTVSLGQKGGSATTVTAPLADADFSNASMSVETVITDYASVAISNLSGSYTLPATDDPDEPAPTTGNFAPLSDATMTLPGASKQSGIYTSDVLGADMAFVFQNTASITFLNNYKIGDRFEYSFTLMYGAQDSTKDNASVTVTLGDLVLSMTGVPTENYGTNINVAATYDGKTVGTPFTTVNSERRQYTKANNAEWTSIFDEYQTKLGNTNTYNMAFNFIDFTCTYENGTLTVTAAHPAGTSSKTLTGTISNADFSDAALTINIAQACWRPACVYGFEGTYTPYVAPEVDPLAPGKFLSINDSLALNFAYAEGALADYTDVEVNASIGERGETLTPVKKTLTDGVYDVYVVDFLTPDLFGTDVEFSITAKKGGEDVSYETTYSVKDYCVNMMNAAGSSDELKSLCASIVEYGEAARLWKVAEGISTTDTSITNGITDLVAGYNAMKPALWSADGKTNNYGLTGSEGPATWNSGNLNLADNIGINFTFTLPEGATMDDYNIVVDVVGSDIGMVGGDVESITDLGNNKYKAVARVFAYDMSKDVTAKIVVNDGSNTEASYVFTSGVQNYVLESIEAGNFTEGTAEYNCAVAFMTYGDAAAAYVG